MSNGIENPLPFATISAYAAPTLDSWPYTPPPAQRIALNYANRSFLLGEEQIQQITLELTATLSNGARLIKT